MSFIPTRKERTKVVLSSVGHHEPIYIPFCGNDGAYQNSNFQSCENPECKDFTVSFDSLDNTQRLLLHWHAKLDHMGFNEIKDLASKGFLPYVLTKARLSIREITYD